MCSKMGQKSFLKEWGIPSFFRVSLSAYAENNRLCLWGSIRYIPFFPTFRVLTYPAQIVRPSFLNPLDLIMISSDDVFSA